MLFSLSVNGNNREVKCYLESDNWIVQNLNNALETWNSKLSEIWQLLTQSPETFKGGDIWSVMLTIHDTVDGYRQSPSIFPVCYIIQCLEQITINHAYQIVQRSIGIGDTAEQRHFLFSDTCQIQLIRTG